MVRGRNLLKPKILKEQYKSKIFQFINTLKRSKFNTHFSPWNDLSIKTKLMLSFGLSTLVFVITAIL
ncbi:MAG TPA: hypothetical protein VJ558_03355, partial [Bacillales bacterium]|nr:hypothetical protein [Bacillales bacterium]